MDWSKIGSAAVGGATGLLGMIGQNKRAEKQHNRQKELMGIQFDNQKLLNQQGHELQMELWKNTNHPAQVKMLQEAGLNPALMYGMSGGGSATTGSQGGGSAAGGQAHAPMDIGQALQAGLMQAEMKLKNSQAKLNEQKAEEAGASKDYTHEKGISQFLDNVVKRFEMDSTGRANINRIVTSSKGYGTVNMSEDSLAGRKAITETTNPEEQNKILAQQLENLKIEEKAKKEGIELTKEQARKIYHDILQGWAKTGIQAINSFFCYSVVELVPI